MLLKIGGLRVPVEKDEIEEYLKAAALKLEISRKKIKLAKILSKKLDIADQKQFYYEVSLIVNLPDNLTIKITPNLFQCVCSSKEKNCSKEKNECLNKPACRQSGFGKTKQKPIIIGFGPAGMFAALTLVDKGIKPIIFERGKKIEERTVDIQKFIKERTLNTESNIQFGEGGAGAYSDGKLFSRMINSEYVNKVLDTFVKFGAPKEISYINKPHLGTDVLCRITANIRNYILERGGEIHYGSKMTDLVVAKGKVAGIVINGEKEYSAPMVFLAVGHSARDVFDLIYSKGILLEQKPISVGVRIEHPVKIINLIRYGKKYKNYPGIGAAVYSLNYNNRRTKRGVNTFCMCPGGEIVNASSENGMLVLNGMSYSARASAFSNSAIVVTCHVEDYKSSHPLAGIRFQKKIEQNAFNAGGKNWNAPAQNLMDYLNGKMSGNLNKNSYKMGVVPADLTDIFPKFVNEALKEAFIKWKEDYPLFVSDKAVLLGAETRTSCPVRIKRNEKYESINVKNLYPIGEGSGYTGGITSSAADAIKAVEKILENRK